jgi:DNA-binding NtrC family response regulator
MLTSLAIYVQGSHDYGNKGKQMASDMSLNLSLEKIPVSHREEVNEWMANYPLVGREPQMNELRRYTAGARFNNSPVISVWGIAGIGKSALVRNLYYDRMVNSKQFNKYCWVDVSHPFNLRDFSRSLISEHHSEKDPIKECRELLSQHQCLVVIDDLQSKEEWDLIQTALVSRPSSSVIVVITTEASIATYCTKNEDQVFNVKGLEADADMDLFRKEVCFLTSYIPFVFYLLESYSIYFLLYILIAHR